jgi:hypothetical protein
MLPRPKSSGQASRAPIAESNRDGIPAGRHVRGAQFTCGNAAPALSHLHWNLKRIAVPTVIDIKVVSETEKLQDSMQTACFALNMNDVRFERCAAAASTVLRADSLSTQIHGAWPFRTKRLQEHLFRK